MNVKNLEKPPLDLRFQSTTIVDWKIGNAIIFDHRKYCIRFSVVFADGHKENRQKGGFNTKAEAKKAKEYLIIELSNHKFVPYNFKLSEFYDYWLYYYMLDERKIAYNTFISYRTTVNRLLEYIGPNRLINKLTTKDLENALKAFPTKHTRKNAYNVLRSSFQYAKAHNIIETDYAQTAIKTVKYQLKERCQPNKRNTLSAEELINIILECKKAEPSIYLLLTMSAATGTRISETLGICYDDIDFTKKEVHIRHQLGRKFELVKGHEYETVLGKAKVKTENSLRDIPLPDFLLDEIIVQKAKHDFDREHDPDFLKGSDYIFTKEHGYPMTRSQNGKLKRILKSVGLDSSKYTWHDIRHSYATILKDSNMSLKVISKALGHSSTDFTDAVYIDHHRQIYDVSGVMEEFCADINLTSTQKTYDISNIDLSFLPKAI